jgi:hypothetical protein
MRPYPNLNPQAHQAQPLPRLGHRLPHRAPTRHSELPPPLSPPKSPFLSPSHLAPFLPHPRAQLPQNHQKW